MPPAAGPRWAPDAARADFDHVSRRAPARSRRLLRGALPPSAGRGRTPCARAGVWRACCGPSSTTRSTSRAGSTEHGVDPVAANATRGARPQCAVAAPGQRRHHLHARQVGVPVVRGVGPRVPCHRHLPLVDPDFAKQQLRLLLRARVPASERAIAGLRVELRRREPARARVGGVLHLPPRAHAHRPWRRRIPALRASRSCC